MVSRTFTGTVTVDGVTFHPTVTVDVNPSTSFVWPNATNVGQLVPTVKTINGGRATDSTWFTGKSFPGSGTQSSPWIIDRVLFTSQVILGSGSNSSALKGKYVKITNSRFYGSPGNPTPGGSAFIWIPDDGPFVTIEDCTLAPNAQIAASGGPASGGGCDKGFFSYVPFTMRRCNIWGANVQVGFEIEMSEGPSLIERCYLHDTWSATDDHTDIINGNFHASHVTVKDCYMDGIRTGNSAVTNGFGIYDDPTNSNAGKITDWHILHNYIDRCATTLLCTDSSTRFTDPFEVRDNVWGRFTLQRWSGRKPSAQSGNVDLTGKALTF